MQKSAWLLIWLILELLAVAVLAGRVVLGWQSNSTSITATHQLIGQSGSPRGIALLLQEAEQCLSYPETVLMVESLRYQDPNAVFGVLQKQNQQCQSAIRRDLSAYWEGQLLMGLGRYVESCERLSSINAKSVLLQQAEISWRTQDASAARVYLQCVDNLRDHPGWVSPYRMSQLYLEMGRYYEEQQSFEDALIAYERSAHWFPTIWAMPYIAWANLLWKQDRSVEAIQVLYGAAIASHDPTASTNLWFALAQRWEELGQLDNAYCAYRQAQKTVGQVSANDFPTSARTRLADSVSRLGVNVDSPDDCNTVLGVHD